MEEGIFDEEEGIFKAMQGRVGTSRSRRRSHILFALCRTKSLVEAYESNYYVFWAWGKVMVLRGGEQDWEKDEEEEEK
jgi:hypothetical protein